ncbi:MAG: hypothetical protein AAGG00_05445 [Cyanobacteria bacterium P01_H01_bin.150]
MLNLTKKEKSKIKQKEVYNMEELMYWWQTKEGEFIPYKELTDSHIQNIVNMFIRAADREKIIPESWIRFHRIMDEVERRNLDVGYHRHHPSNINSPGGTYAYARFPSFSINVNLDKSSIYSEFMDEIVVQKNIIEGDISQFHQSDNLVYLPACYKDAINACIKRWKFECEIWEDNFSNHGCGFAWGNG